MRQSHTRTCGDIERKRILTQVHTNGRGRDIQNNIQDVPPAEAAVARASIVLPVPKRRKRDEYTSNKHLQVKVGARQKNRMERSSFTYLEDLQVVTPSVGERPIWRTFGGGAECLRTP